MIHYNHSFVHDELMFRWYQDLLRSGEIETTFMPRAHALSGWFAVFQAPTELWFASDEQGIWWAGWVEPSYGGVFFGLWIRKDKRLGPVALPAFHHTMTVLDLATQHYPAVYGITKQPALLDPHRHLGYTVMEPAIAGLWGNDPAWLVVLTRAQFTKGRAYGRWWRRQAKKLASDRSTGGDRQAVV